MGTLRACGGLPVSRLQGEQAVVVPPISPHVSWRSLRDPQAVGPPLPGFLFGFQNVVWQFLQLEGGHLPCRGASRELAGAGLQSVGASACGHLDAQSLTLRPLRRLLVQPPSSVLGHVAEVSDITYAQHSPCKQIFLLVYVI